MAMVLTCQKTPLTIANMYLFMLSLSLQKTRNSLKNTGSSSEKKGYYKTRSSRCLRSLKWLRCTTSRSGLRLNRAKARETRLRFCLHQTEDAIESIESDPRDIWDQRHVLYE